MIMTSQELKNLQAPLKEQYRTQPDSAIITLKAQGRIGEGVSCKVETGRAIVEAGLHPATGGNGLLACSGDLLLEALVACAGVTLQAVATAIGIEIKQAISTGFTNWPDNFAAIPLAVAPSTFLMPISFVF